MKEHTVRLLVAVTVLAMLAIYILRRIRPSAMRTTHGAPYGVAAGFATTVANAAGPVMSLYLLSQKLTKEEFVAMGAWFFFAINLTKLPIYAWHGLLTPTSLAFDALLLPAVVAGAVVGRWVVHRIPQRAFEIAVITLTAISTLLLFR